MAAGAVTRDSGRTRRCHNRPGQPLDPDRSSRKRARIRPADDRVDVQKTKSKPLRKSPRLQNQNLLGERGTEKTETRAPRPLNAAKRRRRADDQDHSIQVAKRARHGLALRDTESRTAPYKENLVENWLNQSCWSRRGSIENEADLHEQAANMPRKHAPVFPSPRHSIEESTIVSSRKSERSAASVNDPDFRQSLSYRNIFIECEDPPTELMQKAQEIVSRSRASPEMDGVTIEKVKRASRRLQNEAEDKIIKQLVPDMIPSMKEVPDQRLEMNSDQPWFNSVPVLLNTRVLTTPLPLPRPKPDLAFGYSQAAFTEEQRMTIDLLVDDQFGRSYAVPDQKIRFPFLEVEFKSQAKNGSHYMANNQAANTGAIALNGCVDLMQRSFGMESFDYEEPQYFSISMDHELARINVHWLRATEAATPGRRQHSFHMEGLSQHLLRDADGIRAVSRAVKNILDYGTDTRLQALCSALDAYRETVVRNREAAANTQRRAPDDDNGDDNDTPARQEQTKRPTGRKPLAPESQENGAHVQTGRRRAKPTAVRRRKGQSAARAAKSAID